MKTLHNDGVVGDVKDSLLARSSLYREFPAEREEILRHKWFESERVGRDVGFEAALVSWVLHHRVQWRRERQQAASVSVSNNSTL